MLETQGVEIAIATIPTEEIVQRLKAEFETISINKEVYLAYVGESCARFVGILLTARGNIDELIALCPVTADLVVGSAMWRQEVRRQLGMAKRIACNDPSRESSVNVIWLRSITSEIREVPAWVFSLSCVPLTSDWDGKLQHPKPFCPALFESMAKQPAASKWLTRTVNR